MKKLIVEIFCLMLLVSVNIQAKHTICYTGVSIGDCVNGEQCQRVNALVGLKLSHLSRVNFIDVSGLGVDPHNQKAFQEALIKNNISYTISLRLDSVVTAQRRYTYKNKEGNVQENVTYEGRTNFDITFTDVQTGRSTTKQAYTKVTGMKDRNEAAVEAMKKVDNAATIFILNFFPIEGKVKIVDHGKMTLFNVGREDGVSKGDEFGIYNSKGTTLGKLECKEVLGLHASLGSINRKKNVDTIQQALANGEELTVRTLLYSEPIFTQSVLLNGNPTQIINDVQSIISGFGNLFKSK